jgi:hypothetical protein
MHRYRVIDTHAESGLIALSESAGAHHVARATAGLPDVGVELHGTRATVGFNVLRCVSTARMFRVIFEQVDCGQPPALEQLVQ